MPEEQVFISYSHKDKKWLDNLDTHLKPYLHGSSIVSWSDQQICFRFTMRLTFRPDAFYSAASSKRRLHKRSVRCQIWCD